MLPQVKEDTLNSITHGIDRYPDSLLTTIGDEIIKVNPVVYGFIMSWYDKTEKAHGKVAAEQSLKGFFAVQDAPQPGRGRSNGGRFACLIFLDFLT